MMDIDQAKFDSHIGRINIEEEMRASYIDYSMSVIVGRALPDARDGLKPVHRRALFAMRELGNTHNRPYKKSARVVGDVIGKYHPHGDTAVYDTLVRMSQEFSMRYPLVDGQGNFGSIDGDPPAAMRYTEIRMHRLAEEMLADLEKETVDFGPNYDESLTQPLALPAKVPNLLLNGSTGIAVGMATNIPPHNMNELVDAIVALIDRPDISIDELTTHVHGPDFPTGGVLCGTGPIVSMYRTGRGQMTVRGRAHIEELSAVRERIVITEIPYAVNKTTLVETIARLVNHKALDGISDLRDESNSEGIRVVVELKRGAVAQVTLNNLYKHTQLQTTFGAILLAIDDGKPRVMNLKEILLCFTRHRLEVVRRRAEYDLRKAEARAHILEGLKIALDNLDVVVKIIRASRNRDEAKHELMARLELSEKQTQAILDMRLYQLTGLERDKVEQEYLELLKLISSLRALLASETKMFEVIKDELLDLKKRFGDARRTEIVPSEGEVNIEDLVADRPCIITVSHAGYIKRVPYDTYRAQRRGGKGVAGMGMKDSDYVEHLFYAHTHDTILFFTSSGRVHWEKVYQIPETGRTARGKAIANLLSIEPDDKIAALIRVRDFPDTRHLVMATAKGVVKKTNLSAFKHLRQGGIIAIRIDDQDRLIGVRLTEGEDDLMLATRLGKSIRFGEKALRDQGRATRGVRGIRLAEGDRVETIEVVDPNATFLTCTENGYGKRTSFDQYRRQARGGQGIMAMRTSERNGPVIGAHEVMDTDALMLITAQGKMIRLPVSELRIIGRTTQGVRLINLDAGDKLVSATPVEQQDETGTTDAGVGAQDPTRADIPEEPGATAEIDEPEAETGKPEEE